MKKGKIFTLSLIVFTLYLTDVVQAQQNNKISQNAGGSLLRVKKSNGDDVIGSPYLLEEWVKGNVKFKDNTSARNGDFKYDVIEDLLVVKSESGEENIFSDPIDEFTLTVKGNSKLFKNGFSGENGVNGKSYFEVIYNGKTKLLKRYSKTIIESKGYNTSTITKKYEESSLYYIAKADNKLIPIKKNEKSILDALQKPELSKYVKDNKLNLKSDEDIEKLLAYYDTL